MAAASALYGIFVFLIISAAQVNAAVQSFTAERNIVKREDKIVLVCRHDAPPFGVSAQINKHYLPNKTAYHFSAESVQEDSLWRYDLTLSQEQNIFMQTLTIRNASAEDSGNYSCSWRENNVVTYKFQNISVESEPTSVKLYIDDEELLNGSNKELQPLKAYRLRCVTAGSNPGANISITYGPMMLSPTNVTLSDPIYRQDRQNWDHVFMLPIEFNTTASVSHWIFDAEGYDSQVICNARVSKDAMAISTTFTPMFIEGVPQFRCNDTVYARNGQKNYNINCTVYARPALFNAYVYFNNAKGNDTTIQGFPLGQEQFTSDRRYRVKVDNLNRVKYSMVLTIDAVDTKSMVYYKFVAQNTRGTDQHSVTIKELGSTSHSSGIQSATSLLLFLLVPTFLIRC